MKIIVVKENNSLSVSGKKKYIEGFVTELKSAFFIVEVSIGG